MPAINIARGRDTGIPSLNDARSQLFAMTADAQVKPYTGWLDFAQNIKHPASIINFIAAYGKHTALMRADVDTLEEQRAIATALVLGGDVTINGGTTTLTAAVDFADRLAFLSSTGPWTAENSGLNDVDLWVGGLAEEIMEFGGMLGSTFNYIFEYQMEHLQNGDRFYYLSRTQGMNLLNLLEPNTFTDLIMRNTDLGDLHATHLPAEIMEVPDMILELDPLVKQENYSGNAALNGTDPLDRSLLDPAWDNPILQAIEHKVTRILGTVDIDGDGFVDGNLLKFSGGEHVVLGGTEGNDTLIGDKGIDTLWGDGGDDYHQPGDGVRPGVRRRRRRHHHRSVRRRLPARRGRQRRDRQRPRPRPAVRRRGPGLPRGRHRHHRGVRRSGRRLHPRRLEHPTSCMGNEGDDWIEGGEGFDSLSGENSELFFNSPIIGHDILTARATTPTMTARTATTSWSRAPASSAATAWTASTGLSTRATRSVPIPTSGSASSTPARP